MASKSQGEKKIMQPLFAENLKWHFLKAQIINLSQKKGDLQKHKNVFNQKILNVAIKETVTLKVDFFKSIKWWRGTTITTVTKVK